MTGSDKSNLPHHKEDNSPQHSEDSPRARTWCVLLLLLCGRVVHVALCCPHVVWCLSSGVGKISATKHVDVNVRMGRYISYSQKGSYITVQIGAIFRHAMDMRTQWQNSRNMGYGRVTNGTLRSKQSVTTTSATRA